MSLAQGLLTDKHLHGIPADSRIARILAFCTEETYKPSEARQSVRELRVQAYSLSRRSEPQLTSGCGSRSTIRRKSARCGSISS